MSKTIDHSEINTLLELELEQMRTNLDSAVSSGSALKGEFGYSPLHSPVPEYTHSPSPSPRDESMHSFLSILTEKDGFINDFEAQLHNLQSAIDRCTQVESMSAPISRVTTPLETQHKSLDLGELLGRESVRSSMISITARSSPMCESVSPDVSKSIPVIRPSHLPRFLPPRPETATTLLAEISEEQQLAYKRDLEESDVSACDVETRRRELESRRAGEEARRRKRHKAREARVDTYKKQRRLKIAEQKKMEIIPQTTPQQISMSRVELDTKTVEIKQRMREN
eukprot:773617_1